MSGDHFSATNQNGNRAVVTSPPDGVPAKVSIGPSEFELAELKDQVADSAFTPPV